MKICCDTCIYLTKVFFGITEYEECGIRKGYKCFQNNFPYWERKHIQYKLEDFIKEEEMKL